MEMAGIEPASGTVNESNLYKRIPRQRRERFCPISVAYRTGHLIRQA